jgi:type III pantothenate kinase
LVIQKSGRRKMSERFLLIDAGNSRLKAALYENNIPIESWVFPNSEMEEALSFILLSEFSAILVSSTAANESWFQSRLGAHRLYFFHHHQIKDLKIAYSEPDSIGKDRLAAMAGARILYPGKNICVADAGTCLTLDGLLADGTHLGGIISPGMKMRFASMEYYTERLPLASENELVGEFGDSTLRCLASGGVYGLVAEIEYHQNRLQKEWNQHFELILTGGDGIFLAQRIKPANFVVPDLVFQGMNAVLARLV